MVGTGELNEHFLAHLPLLSVPPAFLEAGPPCVHSKRGPSGSGDLEGGQGPVWGQLEAGCGSPRAARSISCLGLRWPSGLGFSLEVLVNS